MSNIAIITCENYKCCEAVPVMKEQTRDLTVKDFTKVNYIPDKISDNVLIYHDKDLDRFSTFRGYVENYYKENGISGRFNLNTASERNATKVLSAFVISGSRDLYLSFNNRGEIVEYLKNGFEFLQKEYPSFHWVDARIHFDESGLPHLHAGGLPLHRKEDGSVVFSVSAEQKGKDYFIGFQDRFYAFMREKYPDKDLLRTDPNRDHTKKYPVREYKEMREYQENCKTRVEQLKEKIEKLKTIEDKVNSRGDLIDSYNTYFDAVDSYCNTHGISLFQYEKSCYFADCGYGYRPSPENLNPERIKNIEPDIIIEHNISKDKDFER